MMRRRLEGYGSLLALVVLTTCLTGCGSRGLVVIEGTVKVDGAPTGGVELMFFPKDDPSGVTAAGTSNDQGKFTLTSGMDAGVATGKYIVTASYPDPAVKPTPAQMMQGTFVPGPDLFKGKYSKKQTSTVEIEITSGSKELAPIELKKG